MEEEQQDIPHAIQIDCWRAMAVYTAWRALSTMHSILDCCQSI